MIEPAQRLLMGSKGQNYYERDNASSELLKLSRSLYIPAQDSTYEARVPEYLSLHDTPVTLEDTLGDSTHEALIIVKQTPATPLMVLSTAQERSIRVEVALVDVAGGGRPRC